MYIDCMIISTQVVMAGLSEDAIDGLQDIWEGFRLMDQHGVAKENCQSLEDMKQRLRLHHLQLTGQARSPQAVRITCPAIAWSF